MRVRVTNFLLPQALREGLRCTGDFFGPRGTFPLLLLVFLVLVVVAVVAWINIPSWEAPRTDSSGVIAIAESEGDVWVVTARDIYQSGEKEFIPLGQTSGQLILSAAAVADRLWIGTEQGLFTVRDGRVVPVPGIGSPVHGIEEVRGETWIGSNVGVFRLAGGEVAPVAVLPEEAVQMEGPFVRVTAIAEVMDQIWVGTNQGIFLIESGEFSRLVGTPSTAITLIRQVGETTWVSSPAEGLIHFDGGVFVREAPAEASFIEVIEGDVLLGLISSRSLFRRSPGQLDLFPVKVVADLPAFEWPTAISAIGQDIWVGSQDGGVYKLSGSSLTPALDQPATRLAREAARYSPFLVPALLLMMQGFHKGLETRRRRVQQILLSREVAEARSLMQGLFPGEGTFTRPGMEIAHRRREATTIAGDFYNFVRRGDESLGVYFVDVEGHGLAASNQARALYQAVSSGDWGAGDARQALERADLLVREGAIFQREDVALTMNFTEIDLKNRKIRHANAGMPFPLLFRRDQSQPEVLEAAGIYIGAGYARHPVRPEKVEVDIEDGDCLVLFSDGILEATDQRGRLFGQSGIIAAVSRTRDQSPEDIADEIMRAVTAHAGVQQPDDDQTLAVIQIGQPTAGTRPVRVKTLQEENGVFSLLNAGDTASAAHEELRESIKAYVIDRGFGEKRSLQVWAATWEAIQNAIKYGSRRGDVVHLELIPPGSDGLLSVEVRQPNIWEDWDQQFGDRMKSEVKNTRRVILGGRAIIFWLADEVRVTNLGRVMRMRFSLPLAPDRPVSPELLSPDLLA